MKKIIALTGMFLLIAANAFAAAGASRFATTAEAGYVLKSVTAAPALIGKSSKGVRLGCITSITGYSLNSIHISGTKEYGTSYDATAIMVNERGAAYASFAAPTSSVASEAFPTSAGWTQM